jgi:hypothetical protein
MKCSRCSAELPDSATYCFQCGQSVQSATQSASYQYQPGSFSYLPAGTPPWPTAAPAASTATQTEQPGVLELKIAPKPKRSAGSVFAMVGLVLLIPILGVALTMGTLFARGQISFGSSNTASKKTASAAATTNQQPTPAPQATPATSSQNQLPTPTSSKKISDADLNLLLQYPNNWDADQINKTTSGTSLNMHPHEQLNILFQVDHLSTSSSSQYQSADEVNQNILQFLAQQLGVSTMQPVQPTNAQPNVGGATWTQQDDTFQASNGDTYHLTILSTLHNSSYYSIFYLTPQVYYSEAMSKYMQPMLQSVQFIK